MIRLEVPGELRFRGVVVRTVAAACRVARAGGSVADVADVADGRAEDPGALNLSDDFDVGLVSAVSEAFNNVVVHAYEGGAGTVVLEVELGPSDVEVRLLDTGESLDMSKTELPDLDALPEGGLGLFMIRSFVDEFSYEPGSPNRWVMKKLINPQAPVGRA